ncbi:MAG: tetratricopeptide repeat protein [Cyanobacteria bacterium]|nr:tetratricopeptide repeat protein [Cyanobacteriota bacterium]
MTNTRTLKGVSIILAIALGVSTSNSYAKQSQSAARPDQAKSSQSSHAGVVSAENKVPLDVRRAVYLINARKYGLALELVNRLHTRSPKDMTVLLLRAQIYSSINRTDDELSDLNEVLKHDPSNTAALMLRGQVYYAKSDGEKAFVDFDRLVSIQPNSATALLMRGVANVHRFQPEKAMDDLQRSLEIRKSPNTYFTLGAAYINLFKIDEAIAAYNRSIALQPVSEMAHMMRGRCYYMLNEFGPAIEDYTYAIGLNPSKWKLYYYRSQAYEESGQHAKAYADLKQVAVLEPEYAERFYAKDVDSTVDKFSGKQLSLQDSPEDLLVNKAIVVIQKGKYADAYKILSQALKLKPDQGSARLMRGRVLLEQKRYDEALADFNLVHNSDEIESDYVGQFRVLAFLGKKDYVRAHAGINVGLFWDKHWTAGYFHKAFTLEKMNRTNAAISMYEEYMRKLARSKGPKYTKFNFLREDDPKKLTSSAEERIALLKKQLQDKPATAIIKKQ